LVMLAVSSAPGTWFGVQLAGLNQLALAAALVHVQVTGWAIERVALASSNTKTPPRILSNDLMNWIGRSISLTRRVPDKSRQARTLQQVSFCLTDWMEKVEKNPPSAGWAHLEIAPVRGLQAASTSESRVQSHWPAGLRTMSWCKRRAPDRLLSRTVSKCAPVCRDN
jgi:hypothetical protein